MTKLLVVLAFSFFCVLSGLKNGDREDTFPKNDYKMLWRDFTDAIGLDQILDTIGFYFRTNIRIGEAYTWKKFHVDIKDFKEKPTVLKFFYLLHKWIWAVVSRTCVTIINVLKECKQFLLNFLRKKCDIHLGSDAAIHPWNIMMESDQQHIAFLVFVYGLALSLIMMKLLNWWNFMVYLAAGFLIYSFGGPTTVFKWLLCITALFCFVVDTVISYPFHTAVAVLALYLLHILWCMLPTFRRRRAIDVNDAVPSPEYRVKQQKDDVRHQRDFRLLTSRIDGTEEKINLLCGRLERLSRSVEVLSRSMSDEENDKEM